MLRFAFSFCYLKTWVRCMDFLQKMSICLFVWGVSSHSRIFHSYGEFTMTGEGLQIFYLCSALMTIKQWWFFNMPHHLWHGLPFIMVISEDPRHPHLLPSVWQWSCHYLFLRLRSVAAGIQTPNLPLARGKILSYCVTAAVNKCLN